LRDNTIQRNKRTTGCPICSRTILQLTFLRNIKVSFGYDVPILVDYTHGKNELFEHMSIWKAEQ
jgi:hypothetical protein